MKTKVKMFENDPQKYNILQLQLSEICTLH
jgi:hypothetical protein